MNPIVIILIVVAVIAVVAIALIFLGKLSASKKKIAPAVLKRFAKSPQAKAKVENLGVKNAPKSEKTDLKSDEKSENVSQSQQNDDIFIDFSEGASKSQPIVQTYDQLDENDRQFLNTNEQQVAPTTEEEPREMRRKSFEEIMRTRQQMNMQEFANRTRTEQEDDDDDFEKFRAQHSVYSKYIKDESLIEEIQNMSPKARAIFFGNLFKRTNDDE